MGIFEADPDTLADPGAEHALSLADEPVDTLRVRIDRALRYTLSWLSAAGNALDPAGVAFADRISTIQAALFDLQQLIPAGSQFVGKDAKAAYEKTSAQFAQLYRDLAFSADTLPAPALLDQLGDLGAAVFKAPAAAVRTLAQQASQLVADVLGSTAAAIWVNLWPWLLVAGGVGAVYLFRAPLLRAVGKVAA